MCGESILKKSNMLVYILFLLLSEFNSCVELAKTLRIFGINISHDTINRFLWIEGFNPQENLFNFVKNFITPEYNIFVIDDFVIDKFYSKSTEFVYYCWSNLHKRVVNGMHIVDCIATNGKNIILIDFYLKKVRYVKLFYLSKKTESSMLYKQHLFMTFEEFQEVGYISLSMRTFFILERIRIDKKISWYKLRRKLNRIAVGNAVRSSSSIITQHNY